MTLPTPNTPSSVQELRAKVRARRRAAEHYRLQEKPEGHFWPPSFYNKELAEEFDLSADVLEIEIQVAESEAMVQVLDTMIARLK